MKKIVRKIFFLALVLMLCAPLALFAGEKEEKPVILQTHGYRGTTSEVLRATGFLDGVMGKPLPPAKAKVIDVDPAAIETWNTWKVEAYTSIFESTVKNPIKAGRTPFIGYMPLSIYNPWDMLNKDAFEWYSRDVLGWKHKVYWSDADPKKQNDLAAMAIKDGVDAIVLCPADSLANAKIGEMAEKAGVPVVNFGIDIYNRWPMAFVQRDDYESGWYCGKYVRDKLIERFGPDIKIGIDIPIVDVGNSWDAEAEFPYVKAAMAANPGIVAVFEVMGGYHEAWVRAAKDLGWSEGKIKDIIAVDVDFFPVNLDGYINGYQDYCRMMPTGGYMTATALEILKQFWKHGPEALPQMGDIFSVSKYVPELQTNATVPGTDFAPLQWYEHPKWGVVGYTIRPSTCGAAYTPWVLIPDRVVTEADYKEPFIYWNWPVFGYPHRPEILK
ncbi:MAG: substrate-binding domain-containing protein [bacterium]